MIAIIGSGIIGLFTAYKLLMQGKKVRIFENKNKEGNSTDASVGMLAPLVEAKPYEKELFELMIKSKNIWDNFLRDKKFTLKTGLKNNSSLLVATNSDEEESIFFKKKFIEKLGFYPKVLNSEQTKKIEPNLNSNIKCSLFLEDNNQTNPELLKSYLKKKITKMGGEVFVYDQINDISFTSTKLIYKKKKFNFEKIVIACGAWSNFFLKNKIGIEFPMRPIKGVSMIFEAKKKLFKNNIWFKKIYVAPRENNQFAIGATEDEKGFEKFVTLDEIFYLSTSIWEYLPEIQNFRFLKSISGLRSLLNDGKPVIGSLKKNKKVICAFGHFRHGILLAPITAEIVSNYVFGKEIERNSFFSPNRFNL
jgi:glycine oxidase